MPCGKIECEIDEVIDKYAQKQAGRAFVGMENVRNSPDGVDELTASAWARFWNGCVNWILEGDEESAALYKAKPMRNGDTWGIQTERDVGKLRRKKK